MKFKYFHAQTIVDSQSRFTDQNGTVPEQRGLASAISCGEVRYAVLDRLLVPGFLSIFVDDSKVALRNQKAPRLYMHSQCSWHQRQHLFKIGIKWCKNTRENIMSQQASNPLRFWIPTASVRFTKNLSATPPSLLGEIFTREKWCSDVPTTGHWYNIEIISEINLFQNSPWRCLFETN